MSIQKLSSIAVAGLLFFSLTLTGQLFAEDKPASEKSETIAMAGGKAIAAKPADWKTVKPKMQMIEHEFNAPEVGEDSARITIMQATGSIDANIDRWVAQFEGAKREDAKVEDKEVSGVKVHVVDITGTFVQKMGGPFAPGPTEKLENHRMLAAIIETKEEGKIFIKMTGPAATVEKLADGMKKMVYEIEVK